MASTVANAPAVVAQLNATGQTATVTSSTTGGSVSVLVSLSGSAGGGGGDAAPPAAYDPCAGVTADYCGT